MLRIYFLFIGVFFLVQNFLSQQWLDKKYTYDSILNISYGSAYGFSGALNNLEMDIYLPNCDDPSQESRRPLLMVVHGGAFIAGDKTENNIQYICKQFAKRGYVTASINYRLGFISDDQYWSCNYPYYNCLFATDSSEWFRSYYRGVQDAKGALRYLINRNDLYRIDTSNVFVAGESAGAFISLGVAFMDLSSERPSQTFAISTAPLPNPITDTCVFNSGISFTPSGVLRPDLGGIDGTIEPSSIQYTIKGVGNMYGAMFSNLLLQQIPNQPKPAIFSFHQPCDLVVSIDSSKLYWGLNWCMANGYNFYGIANTPKAYGSRTISNWNTNLNLGYTIQNEFTTSVFPYSFLFGSKSCTDQISNPCHAYDYFILREQHMAEYFAGMVTTNPICDTAALALSELSISNRISLVPNPTSGEFKVVLDGPPISSYITIFDCFGNIVLKKFLKDSNTPLELMVEPGVYFVELNNENGRCGSRLLISN